MKLYKINIGFLLPISSLLIIFNILTGCNKEQESIDDEFEHQYEYVKLIHYNPPLGYQIEEIWSSPDSSLFCAHVMPIDGPDSSEIFMSSTTRSDTSWQSLGKIKDIKQAILTSVDGSLLWAFLIENDSILVQFIDFYGLDNGVVTIHGNIEVVDIRSVGIRSESIELLLRNGDVMKLLNGDFESIGNAGIAGEPRGFGDDCSYTLSVYGSQGLAYSEDFGVSWELDPTFDEGIKYFNERVAYGGKCLITDDGRFYSKGSTDSLWSQCPSMPENVDLVGIKTGPYYYLAFGKTTGIWIYTLANHDPWNHNIGAEQIGESFKTLGSCTPHILILTESHQLYVGGLNE